jgi:hypothetical protein
MGVRFRRLDMRIVLAIDVLEDGGELHWMGVLVAF